MVTNFSDNYNKEVYYACPYCLTKIEYIKEADHTYITQRPAHVHEYVNDIVIKKLESLEKERADLMSEVQELRRAATKKIGVLEEEVAALREEAEQLRELTEG